MTPLEQKIEGGEVILLDGATGTDLEKRGVPMDDAAWCAAALATHPDVVRNVHEDYIRAGAEVIITNTFPAARHVLEEAGLGERFRELNARAVGLAREARENAAEEEVYIAGSISTFPARHDHSYDPDEHRARANYREQAEVLADSGVDLLALEMMRDLEQTAYAVEAAVETGLPVWVGFSCRRIDEGTVVLWDGRDTLAEALEEIPARGVTLISVMHTLVEDAIPALREVRERWDGPVGAYPHSGKFVMPNWQFTDMISPEDFAQEARRWVELDARVIGGCCGIGPEHIRELKETLPARVPPEE
ncbi:MAG: homocysteine S-methyltransferase family protein [Actinomycetota bacterium]|nr:homocysteine S-methyltransferase family protein [Actinomycetota bacterium]